MSTSPTLEALVREFEKITRQSEDTEGFVSTQDFADAQGISQHTAQTRLRPLFRAGLLEVRTRRDMRMDGAPKRTPVYRLKSGGRTRPR